VETAAGTAGAVHVGIQTGSTGAGCGGGSKAGRF